MLQFNCFATTQLSDKDGVFTGTHTGRLELFYESNFELRVRHKNDNNEYGGWAVRPFVTGAASEIFPLLLDDIVDLPVPVWQDSSAADIVLPTSSPTSFTRLEAADNQLLLEFESFDGSGNLINNPSALSSHVAARVHVRAGGSMDLTLPESDILFTDDSGVDHTVYLPSIGLTATQELYFWISNNGSSYEANAAQTDPDFTTLARGAPVPWTAAPGYKVEVVATGFQLPVNIAFVPNPGPGADAPIYYVTELYGTIKVVLRDGTVQDYATDLLDFDPLGAFPGAGEQGITGIVVDPDTGAVFASMLYSSDPPNEPGPDHYPKVDRFQSIDGGRTALTQTTILDMVGETQGQSHQISNLTIGPDDKLYVHMGDGFDASTAQNLDSYRGKILRLNLDGTAPPDNPFYDNSNGINARDYVFAYGVRNPFGGGWRSLDGMHYEVENGPNTDRLAQITSGTDYGWDGDDSDLLINAIYTWNPAHAPVNLAFVEPETYGGSGFPADKMDHLFVTESGPTYAAGPQVRGKRLVEFVLDGNGNLVSGPTTFVEYNGSGRATAVGLAVGPDGLYFSDLYKDQDALSPIDAGANILRVKFVGEADFTADETFGPQPLTVQFTDASTVVAPSGWLWDFGDGTSSNEQHPEHTYAAAGSYDVTLRVTGDNGSSVLKKDDYIQVGRGVGLVGDYYSGINFDTYLFTRIDPTIDFDWGNGSPDPGVPNDLFSIRWRGQVLPQYSEVYTFSIRANNGIRLWVDGVSLIDEWNTGPTATYSGAILLTADEQTDIVIEYYENTHTAVAELSWESASQPLEIIPQSQLFPFIAGFVADSTFGNAPFAVQFTNTSYAPSGTTWQWDFGDGGSSTVANPMHTYNAAGTYTVTLIATGPNSTDGLIRTDYITVVDSPVTADFFADITTGTVPLDVQFTNSSTAPAGTTWQWDFGDGGSSPAANPMHTYNAAGTYTVTLVATGPNNTDTRIRANYITVVDGDEENQMFIPIILKGQ